jgi:hypothetical protein
LSCSYADDASSCVYEETEAFGNHVKDIRLSKLVKQSMQFGPIPTAAGSFLAKDPLASCGFEGANLCGGILFVCGDSCVTDKHVAQRYCE